MNLFTPKKNQFNSFIERAKYLMVYRLTLVFTIVIICLSVVFFKVEFYALMSYLLALSISVISLIYLAVTLKYEHLFSFYAILGSLIAHFSCNFSLTTSHYVDFIWMMIASFLAFVGKGRKWGLTILTANAVGIVYFMFFTHEQHLAVIEPFNTFETIGATIELLLAIFIFAYVMSQFIAFQNYSETKLRKANLELETQNSLILTKNRENSTLLKGP